MTTLADLRYHRDLYSQFEPWALVLHQVADQHPHPSDEEINAHPFPLPSAQDIHFAEPFNSTDACRDHIVSNTVRQFELFAFGDDLCVWLHNGHLVPSNLRRVIAFGVPSNDHEYFRGRIGRFRSLGKVLTAEQFERNLLLDGMDHIQCMRRQFIQDQGILNLLNEDYRRLCRALERCVARDRDRLDISVHLAVEASS